MKECLNCSSKIPNRNVYCNNQCQSEHQYNQRVQEWLSGKNVVRKGGTSIPSWMRTYLLSENHHKCSECGWGEKNQFTNTIPLDVDHIDGDAYNNTKENLRVLCPNCHSLKKTFKNTGKRKSSRTYRNTLI